MDEILKAWRRGWAPPDRRALRLWARGLKLEGDYAKRGFFTDDDSRHLGGPMDALSNPLVRMVNSRKAVQTFGSGIGDVFFHWVHANAPGPFQATFQSDDDAGDHFETRIRPTMEANPFLAPALEQLARKRTLYKFPRFNAYFQGANPNSLQRKSVLYEWNDEIWRWKKGLLKEAFARTEAFKHRCKIYNASQAGLVDDDEDTNWTAGRQHEWGWGCPKCGYEQQLVMFANILDKPQIRAGITWNADARRPDGRWDIARAAASARLVCCKCGADMPDEPRSWAYINRVGRYICTTPDVSVRNSSFRWNSLVTGFWADLVAEFLQASEIKKSGSAVPLMQFYQKKLVIPWDDAMSETPAVLKTGEFMMGEPLEGAAFTFLTADYQEGRGNDSEHWWVLVWSWKRNGDSRMIFWGRKASEADIRAKQLELKIPGPCVCLDGGDKLLRIAGICARYGWTVLRGTGDEYFRHTIKGQKKPRLRAWSPRKKVDPGRGTRLEGRGFAWCFDWSNPSVKNITWRLRHGHGAKWELPVDLPVSFRDQVDSEVKVRLVSKNTGAISYYWKPLSSNNPNNHAWDAANMQTVCALIARCLAFDLDDNTKPDSTAKDPAAGPRAGGIEAPHDKPEQLTLLPTA